MADATTTPVCVSRKEAMAQGLKYYFTGKPCRHGHIDRRRAPEGNCVQCIADRDRRKYERTADVVRRKRRERYADDPKRFLEINERSRQKHLARRLERQREISRQWAKDNLEKRRASCTNRRARIAGNGGTHSAEDVTSILNAQGGRCAYCRVKLGKKFPVDHIIAIAKGGTNDRRNLQILCPIDNAKKGARDPVDFARSLGMLI